MAAKLAILGLDHVGIAVQSIASERAYYEDLLGMQFEGSEELIEDGLRVAFYAPPPGSPDVHVELLEPVSDDSVIARHLERRGPGLHHLAYAVEDVDRALGVLRASGIRLVDQSARRGARGRRIAFLHPASTGGVLTELCEVPRRSSAH